MQSTQEKERIMGIDYGTKRVGLALSDESLKFALPLAVFGNTKNLLEELVTIANYNHAHVMIIGESRNFKMEGNPILEASMKLKSDLEARGFEVHMEPEFMTSMQAERFQGKNEMTDASAAAIILQSYLDKENSKNNQ